MRFLLHITGAAMVIAVAGGCSTTAEADRHCTAKPAGGPAAISAVKPAASPADRPFDKPGFHTVVKDGRLWIFAEDSDALADYKASGNTPAVHSTRVKAGPQGMTIIAPESETLVEYMVAKPGFHTVVKDGRLWVFAEGSDALADYKASGNTPAVHSTRVKAGPLGMTIIAPESETLVEYMVAKPGFHTVVKDGRLWVFAEGSDALADYKASGNTPAVHSTRVKAGPLGMTIIAPATDVLDNYMN